MKKAIAILFLCLFSGIVSAQTLWGGFMIDIKNAAGDTVSTTNLQAVKSFVGAGGGATDLTFTGASSPYTLASSTGTDVTISAGTNVTLTRTGNDLEIASSGGSGAVATDAIWDAKGDLAVGTGANTASRLAVGTDGKQIYADAAESTGLRWGASIISPSQITSDQDDYAPTGWAKAQIVRLDGDNGIRAITSFAATFDGDIKKLLNVGSYPIYIPGEHPDGTAANRVTTKADFYILPGDAPEIMYSGTTSRWVILSNQSDIRFGRAVLHDFKAASVATGDHNQVLITASGTGTVSATAPTSALPNSHNIGTSTSATAGGWVGFSKGSNTFSYFSSAHIFGEYLISIPTLSDGTNTFQATCQITNLMTSSTVTGNNSCGITYSNGVNSGKFQLYSQDNAGASTTADSGVTVAAGTLYKLRVEINKARDEIRYYINGAMVGRITANMPQADVCGSRAIILKSAGATARNLYVHSMNAGAIYP